MEYQRRLEALYAYWHDPEHPGTPTATVIAIRLERHHERMRRHADRALRVTDLFEGADRH
jgi:hypothetical protein